MAAAAKVWWNSVSSLFLSPIGWMASLTQTLVEGFLSPFRKVHIGEAPAHQRANKVCRNTLISAELVVEARYTGAAGF